MKYMGRIPSDPIFIIKIVDFFIKNKTLKIKEWTFRTESSVTLQCI
jgi:hypothetical protein